MSTAMMNIYSLTNSYTHIRQYHICTTLTFFIFSYEHILQHIFSVKIRTITIYSSHNNIYTEKLYDHIYTIWTKASNFKFNLNKKMYRRSYRIGCQFIYTLLFITLIYTFHNDIYTFINTVSITIEPKTTHNNNIFNVYLSTK